MRQQSVRLLAFVAIVVSTAVPWNARAGDPLRASSDAGRSSITLVPWKLLDHGDRDDPPARGTLILYWIPSTREEMRHSPLLTSRALAIYSSQCVAMRVVRPDDEALIAQLGANEMLPAVVLIDAEGTVIAREEALRVMKVEKLVQDAIEELEAKTDALLGEARAKSESGERETAIALYARVCAQRCLFPRKARDAERALKRLGVTDENRCSK